MALLVNTNVAPQYIFLAAASSDPDATLLIEPNTFKPVWTLQDVDFEGDKPIMTVPVGIGGDQLLFVGKNEPLLHMIGVNPTNRVHVKSILPNHLSAVVTDQNGFFAFGALSNSIFTWSIAARDAISATKILASNITALAISPFNAFIFAGTDDGSIYVYAISTLIQPTSNDRVNSYHTYAPHCSAVNAISVYENSYVLSIDSAHTAVMYVLESKTVAFSCSFEQSLTACFFNPKKNRVFLGTESGLIIAVSLTEEMMAAERHINVVTKSGFLPKKHAAAITNMDITSDNTTLISGDADGVFVLWNVRKGCVLRCGRLNGPIITARFVSPWKSVFGKSYKPLEINTTPFSQIPIRGEVEFNSNKASTIQMFQPSAKFAKNSLPMLQTPPVDQKSDQTAVQLMTTLIGDFKLYLNKTLDEKLAPNHPTDKATPILEVSCNVPKDFETPENIDTPSENTNAFMITEHENLAKED